jgi:ubiquinone/menaquinone biosynthesis C-methylase UbiE
MPEPVDLYDNAYGKYELEVYRQVRIETYGEDLGQTSWVSTEESREIPSLLELTPDSFALEIGCGSGRYALQVAGIVGCRIVGLDINGSGIDIASQSARSRHLDSRVSFEQCDVSKGIPFPDQTFDAVFANDVLCHIPERLQILREQWRVLKADGRMLFSDALIIAGIVSHQEIMTRSSIGYYLFSPPGENERLIESAGFHLVRVVDTTLNASRVAKAWHDAREKWRDELILAEGALNFDGVQRFLSCAHALTKERRLLRRIYLARKDT